MRWKPQPKIKSEWHRWFAWHPVWGGGSGQWMWLETVMRRCAADPLAPSTCGWLYKPATDQ